MCNFRGASGLCSFIFLLLLGSAPTRLGGKTGAELLLQEASAGENSPHGVERHWHSDCCGRALD